MKRKNNQRKELDKIRITNLEKVLINYATPFEFLVLRGINLYDKLDGDSDWPKERWKHFSNKKITDYRRLINADRRGEINKDVLNKYFATPCGTVMILTYMLFHKSLNNYLI